MGLSWGYSPKVEKYIPLGDYPADQYLIIAQQVIENLGWKLSHVSESGLIAYTGLSFQSYSEEISIRVIANFAIFKSECVGVQLLFNDYGKNEQNLQKFFDEFEYVQFHLKDIWKEKLEQFHEHIATQDDQYFEKAPLAIKNKIKNLLYLFIPRKGYWVTPILLIANILYYLLIVLAFNLQINQLKGTNWAAIDRAEIGKNIFLNFGADSRDAVLSGQVWRLLSHQFIHFSLPHLFFNMYAFIYIGLMVENKLGSWKTLALYLLTGVCGGLFSVLHYKTGIMAGASGAIMGMFGAFLALLLSNAFEKNANRALLISTLLVCAFMLINGLTGKKVDNSAHFGGLISGFVFGYLLYNPVIFQFKIPVYWRIAGVFLLVLGLGAGVMRFAPIYQIKEYAELRAKLLDNEVIFNEIYTLNRDMSKAEQLQLIKRCALVSWKRNLDLIGKMEKMVLLDKDRTDLSFRAKKAKKGYQLGLMLYEDYQSEDRPLRTKIQRKLNELTKLTQSEGSETILLD